jgi:hypothetical protein
MNRRGFLNGILLGCAAPAIVQASSLMKIVVPERTIVVSPFNEEFARLFTEILYKEANRQSLTRRLLADKDNLCLDKKYSVALESIMVAETRIWHTLTERSTICNVEIS